MKLKEIRQAIDAAGRTPSNGYENIKNLHWAAICLDRRLSESKKVNASLRKRIKELETTEPGYQKKKGRKG